MPVKKIQIGQYEFIFRWSLFVVLVLLVPVGLFLASWQMDRAKEKEITEAVKLQNVAQDVLRVRPSDTNLTEMIFRDVEVDGNFVLEKQILLDNQKHNRKPGYHVFTPIRLSGSNTYILVARGWVQQGADRRFIPDLPGPENKVKIRGKAAKIPVVGMKVGEPGESGLIWPKRLTYIDLPWLEKETGFNFLPYVIYQTKGNDFGLARDWKQQLQMKNRMPPEKHIGYALQWLALTVLVVIMYLILSIKRSTREPESGERS